MTLLIHDGYLATMGGTREPLVPNGAASVDLGRYIDSIDPQDFQGFDFSSRVVASAVSIDDGAWQHVIINRAIPNVFQSPRCAVCGNTGSHHDSRPRDVFP